MARDDPASGFRDVDERDARKFVAYLDEQARSPFWQARKRETVDLMRLRPGGAGLDVGCGVGDEVRAIAAVVGEAGRAAGVDSSTTLIEEARTRGPGDDLRVADAHALPFDAASFDGVRVERTLQHVEDPGAVVAEMARVTRDGGRAVAIEPDWDTLVIDARPLEVTRAVCRAWAGGIRHADVGRRLGDLLRSAGLREVHVQPRTWMIDSYETAEQQFELSALAEATAGGEEWLAGVRDREFLAAITYFLATGRR